jgi:DNA-binding helix-hairpin-helix protein with protein kinase domain
MKDSIATAADITNFNLSKVRDIDKTLIGELMEWRYALEAQFWNASTYGLPPHEERTILEQIHRENIAMRRGLLAAKDELATLSGELRERQSMILAKAEPYRRVIFQYGPTLAALEPLKK